MTETHYGGVRMESPYSPGARVRTPRGVGVLKQLFFARSKPRLTSWTVKIPGERHALPFYLHELTPLDHVQGSRFKLGTRNPEPGTRKSTCATTRKRYPANARSRGRR